MNKAVAVLTEWNAFDEKHPDAGIEDFCRYYLIHKREKVHEREVFDGIIPPKEDSQLMKLLGRIVKLHGTFTAAALADSGLNSIEEFSLLAAIRQLNGPRKTEAISACLYEISTGTDMLKRYKKAGYITETPDLEDKRSKRISLTPKGEKVMKKAQINIVKLAQMMMHGVDPEDKKLCFQLLKRIEIEFSASWQSFRGKTFDEIYAEVMATTEIEWSAKRKPANHATDV